MDKFQKQLDEQNERVRIEMENEPDMEKDMEMLKEMIVEKPEVMIGELSDINLLRIKDWTIVDLKVGMHSERIKIEREDGSIEFYKFFEDVCKKCTILDMSDLYNICLIKEYERLHITSEKLTWEQIVMMFEPNRFRHLFQSRTFVKDWKYFTRSGVHRVTFQDGQRLFMLITRYYDLCIPLCRELLRVKLIAAKTSDEAINLVYMVANQKHKREKLTK